jgi:hypothetical protein
VKRTRRKSSSSEHGNVREERVECSTEVVVDQGRGRGQLVVLSFAPLVIHHQLCA